MKTRSIGSTDVSGGWAYRGWFEGKRLDRMLANLVGLRGILKQVVDGIIAETQDDEGVDLGELSQQIGLEISESAIQYGLTQQEIADTIINEIFDSE